MNTPTVATSNAGPSAARNAVELLNEVADGSLSPMLKRHDPRHSDKMNNKIVSQSRFLPQFHRLSLHFYLLLQIKASPWPLIMLLLSLLLSPLLMLLLSLLLSRPFNPPLESRATGWTAASWPPSCIIFPLIELLLDVSPPKPQELLENSFVVLLTPR
jgi:hypothetical protein